MIIYFSHLRKLQQSFDSKNSPLKLCYSEDIGFGVIAKHKITKTEQIKQFLDGFGQTNMIATSGSWFSEIGNEKGETVPLLGPMNFMNHGCKGLHSNINVRPIKHEDNKFYINLKSGKKIEAGDELLWDYQFTGKDRKGFVCVICRRNKQRREKAKRGVVDDKKHQRSKRSRKSNR